MDMSVKRAADMLLGGGIITYPTEGVFGLGCLPDDADTVLRLLELKRRSPAKGLILIAASRHQLHDWIMPAAVEALPRPDPAHAVTWIVAPTARVSPLVTGSHDGVAVRITTHPIAADLCKAVASPIVSTSANVAGRPTARTRFVLRRQFGDLVDYIVPGDCGPATGASEIRELRTGRIIRAGAG